jgi:hypothetical protein
MAFRSHSFSLTAWLIPMLYALGALVSGFIVPRLTNDLLPHFVSTISVNAAIGIYTAVASGMIALTGIVFSLTFVMVQFSATAYSPRLVPSISCGRSDGDRASCCQRHYVYRLDPTHGHAPSQPNVDFYWRQINGSEEWCIDRLSRHDLSGLSGMIRCRPREATLKCENADSTACDS